MDVGARGFGGADQRERRRYNGAIAIAAMIALSNPGAASMTAAPAFLSAFAGDQSVTTAQASTLGAVNLAGMATAIVLSSFGIAKVDRRLLAGLGITLAAGGALLCSLASLYPFLLAGQLVAGLGVGVGFTVAIGSLAGTASPERNFGISATTNQVATAALLAVLAHIGLNHGHGRVMLVLACYALLMGFLIPALPARAPDARTPGAGPADNRLGLGLFGLAASFLLMAGVGGVWPFWGQIAQAHKVSPSMIASALAFSGWGAVAGGLAATLLGNRVGRTVPMSLSAVGLIACMALALFASSPSVLTLSAIGIMFFWIALVPYYLGMQAALDPSGRLAVLSSACMPLGIAAGQFLTGTFSGRSFEFSTFAGMAAIAASTLAMISIDRFGSRAS